MKRFTVILVITSCLVKMLSAQLKGLPTDQILKHTYYIEVGSKTGTGFIIKNNNDYCLITAKHLLNESKIITDSVEIKILLDNRMEAVVGTVHLHENNKVDVVVFKLSDWSRGYTSHGISGEGYFFGDRAFFLGFPLNRNFSSRRNAEIIPFIKSATISALTKFGNETILFLDGHNNKGFSGGPIIAYNHERQMTQVIGVISGYYHEKKSTTGAINGVRFGYNENSGIIKCVPAFYINEILEDM